MSRIVKGWRCAACGGKVRVTDAREEDGKKTPGRWNYVYCNFAPCLNSPAQKGGDRMSDVNFRQGFTPNWVTKI